ncbi:peptidase family M1-domain-containing protein [Glomus cerebriforme]|uniref:Leukotriene A(4) hydrolase n=1 Tax=Glomus cerebriforme TaxID=658196 RepID=A0A397TS64_9GLOM|nr:peptidase family M1-domain-containing protein [Glomus cerebriforme]
MIYDPNTLSNINEVQTIHLELNLKVDFEHKILDGSVILSLIAITDIDKVTLDTRNLVVKSVSRDGKELKFLFGEETKCFGKALHIELGEPLTAGTKFELKITYNTTKQSTAVQWLEPSQTVGKKHPYLFTQCQAIHARSLLPCQDTPCIKLTYSANIQVSHPLRAVMSAIGVGEEELDDNNKLYKFEQKVKIPSYLIALAVGNLAGKDIGPRSTVWTEPEVLKDAAWEFEDTEKFIATGEELLTPYEWGKYDLLVLPASFPYGGMENPCLTFVTPTLLAGDRSLVDVVAHEISHSWMGNLVTTANWEHFWLNEGWTMFIERKITGRLHGEKEMEFDAIIGWNALEEDVKRFGESNPLTALQPILKGVDPDDSFSSVPYEKGFNFLYHIQKVIGGPEFFEPYMKAHVKEFAGKSITTEEWKNFLYSYFGTEKKDLLDTIDWNGWLHSPGMPPVKNEFDQTLAKACNELAKRWDSARNNDKFEFLPSDIEKFTTGQKIVFLERVSEYPPLPHPAIVAMDKVYKFTTVHNSEIRFRWQKICLLAEYEPIFPHVVKFVTEQGRMKFVRPLYRLLNNTKNGSDLAKKTFIDNRSFYHPIAATMIEKDILKGSA